MFITDQCLLVQIFLLRLTIFAVPPPHHRISLSLFLSLVHPRVNFHISHQTRILSVDAFRTRLLSAVRFESAHFKGM